MALVIFRVGILNQIAQIIVFKCFFHFIGLAPAVGIAAARYLSAPLIIGYQMMVFSGTGRLGYEVGFLGAVQDVIFIYLLVALGVGDALQTTPFVPLIAGLMIQGVGCGYDLSITLNPYWVVIH